MTSRSHPPPPVPVPRSWLLGELRTLGLTAGEEALFLALWAHTHASQDGLTTEVSVSELSGHLGLSRETISRSMTRLVGKDFISRERRHGETAVTRIKLDSIKSRSDSIARFAKAAK